jgi:hypothetical protein
MPKTSRNWIQWESCVGMNENPCNTHTYKKKTMHKNNTPQMKAKFCTLGRLHHPSKQTPLGYKSRPIHAHGWDKMECVPLNLTTWHFVKLLHATISLLGLESNLEQVLRPIAPLKYTYRGREREGERESLHYWWLFH